jgi:hypothetical protein
MIILDLIQLSEWVQGHLVAKKFKYVQTCLPFIMMDYIIMSYI